MTVSIRVGDALTVLRTLPSESVHCSVTSPPYYGLRDYGTEPRTWGGDLACEHSFGQNNKSAQRMRNGLGGSLEGATVAAGMGEMLHPSTGAFCRHCNAWRGSLGLEPTPALYIEHMVEVFREVRRVLRKDGTLWLVIGDSYSAGKTGRTDQVSMPRPKGGHRANSGPSGGTQRHAPAGCKPKDLLGIPWMLAFALRDDGWYLRSEITWAKRAPMPESVTDRPTSATEKVFLFTKAPRYFYDAQAVAEPTVHCETTKDYTASHENMLALSDPETGRSVRQKQKGKGRPGRMVQDVPSGLFAELEANPRGQGIARSSRSSIQTERCGKNKETSLQSLRNDENDPRGISKKARRSSGTEQIPRIREAASGVGASLREREGSRIDQSLPSNSKGAGEFDARRPQASGAPNDDHMRFDRRSMGSNKSVARVSLQDMLLTEAVDARSHHSAEQGRTTHSEQYPGPLPQLQQPQKQSTRNLRNFWLLGPAPFAEAHFATFPPRIPEIAILAGTRERGVVLDPFFGAGTTGLVAERLGRDCIGIELNETYAQLSENRIRKDAALRFSQIEVCSAIGALSHCDEAHSPSAPPLNDRSDRGSEDCQYHEILNIDKGFCDAR